MADVSLRNKWLLDAAEDGRTTSEQQIAWLRIQRRVYSASVGSGDWAVTAQGVEGRNSTQLRGVSDKANHDAIVAALRFLGATDLGSGGKILIPQYTGIQ